MNFPYKSVQCFIVHLIIHFVLIIHFLFYIMTDFVTLESNVNVCFFTLLIFFVCFFCYATALCELNSK